MVSKRARLDEIYRRLQKLPPAGSGEEIRRRLDETINQVEDELTGIPFDPTRWKQDGRIYPPRDDYRYVDPVNPRVVRFRTAMHNVYIGANGAIEIRTLTKIVEFSKRGADGQGIPDL